jgi:hypothetical protein
MKTVEDHKSFVRALGALFTGTAGGSPATSTEGASPFTRAPGSWQASACGPSEERSLTYQRSVAATASISIKNP